MAGFHAIRLALVGLVAAASAGTAQEPTLAEGAQVYAASCSRCHNPRAPNERSDREWDAIMLHMRTRANLFGRDARAVLYFLQVTNTPAGGGADAAAADRTTGRGLVAAIVGTAHRVRGGAKAFPVSAPADTGDPVLGQKLMESKGCIACHKAGKHKSGALGPDLNTVLQRRDTSYILQKLADPAADNARTQMPRLPLTPEERQAILAYLVSIQK